MFVIMATARGPSIVEHGVISIGFISVNSENDIEECIRINLKPFVAQLDNEKQLPELTADARDPLEAMQVLHVLLEKQNGNHCVVLGDPSGLNYYLNMAERPGLFHRPFASIICETADKRYWKTQGMVPDKECKDYIKSK